MQHALDVFLSLAGRHPRAALAFIGLVAFAESLAIVGTLVPAAVVLFGAGALVGHGTLDLAWALAVAVVGAVAGNALSYELGRHQQERVRAWPLFRRYADHLGKAEGLIARHGAMSVLLARFAGAVRAFVPLLAGFARMPAGRFYATNVASALLWAPAHILPGVVFGASLHLAEQASGRLAVLALLLAALVWGATWIVRITIRVVVPLTRVLRAHALRAAGTREAWWTRFIRLLLDPGRPGSEALLAALALLLASMWLFLGIVEDVVTSDPLVAADHAVFTFLQQLRTEPMDRVMFAITELGSVGVMLPLVVAVAAWLAWQRSWRTAGYWIATVASAEAMVQVLKFTLGRHRPLSLYRGVEQFSFPSGHATISAVVLALLAFLLTRGQSMRWRIGIGAVAAVYAALVGFSRLYLGAHWLSDVLGGFSFGLAAVALSAMVYTQHRVDETIHPRGMAVVALVTVVVAASGWGWWRAPADLQFYAAAVPPQATTLQAWSSGGYRLLPLRRHEVAGELKEPFTLQVACAEGALRDGLRRSGWVAAPGLGIASVLQAIAPHPAVGQLPLLPRYDGGRASAIDLMLMPAPGANARNVLRLWDSGWRLPGNVPIWYGAYDREVQLRPNYSFLRRQPQPASAFVGNLATTGWQRLDQAGGTAPELWACTMRSP
ncbi:phosphatase PAP2 family protein [Ramlibacter sp. G-1-2-2]|uniref:Phosphatase PAP2 family protein n=1 Tax=Ramlibacter agri TaxID=2728837 RepID=A0A848H210_9BURK|nr:bifunctional DedA family/phosphatase PAP2 family protein [Ramlibacter agri]NML44604.1 phosphatase PAP2 family protein [Ramlibacter agri]